MANILIVDDNVINRKILHELIVAIGHTPILAENGRFAMNQMKKLPPDLVLLDILMPEMDGYEVLGLMKKDNNLRSIPTIMITAVHDMDSAAQCIAKGADDYLNKPFNPTLLKARIKSCMEKKRLQDQEKEYSVRLEEKVRLKTKELSKAHERLSVLDKAKSDFLELMIQDLRSPLFGVFGATEILFKDGLNDATRKKFKNIFQISKKKILTILEGAELLSQIQIPVNLFSLKPNAVSAALNIAAETSTAFARSRKVIIAKAPDCDGLTLCDQQLLVKALTELLETAVKFSNEGNTVNFTCNLIENEISINILAFGRTIPEEAIPRFFEVFSIAESITPGRDLGLGPPVAERIIKLFDGSVAVENQDPPGIAFTVKLKKVEKNE